jgi:Zn finger protein HypA/HybF involved in hydrogenase expression
MLDARLARVVVKTLRAKGWSLAQVRLNVRGGRTEPAMLEEGLRAQLMVMLPEEARSVPAVEIRRVPFSHMCSGCGQAFEAPQIAAGCPNCGAESLPELTDEEIEVEKLERIR